MKAKLKVLGLSVIILSILLILPVDSQAKDPTINVQPGITEKKFLKYYPKNHARTYRTTDKEAWLTYDFQTAQQPYGLVTFHFKEGKLLGWVQNDRTEIAKEYLGEFCSQGIMAGDSKVFQAIWQVFMKVPDDVFFTITNRRRPVLFTEYYDSGMGQFANSSEIYTLPNDPPAFEDGLTIVKLSSGLNEGGSVEAITGIVAHELAHRVLEHAKKKGPGCEMEREANRLIQIWGFKNEFLEAKKFFGHDKFHQSNPCPEDETRDDGPAAAS